ncbi:MAG: hypothetical protein L0312_29255 [Acidobacteria bacterium]|nr:hypothetical protein [Acidobacteriota bacterium]
MRKQLTPETEAAIWLRILHPKGDMSPRAARAILRLTLPAKDRTRVHALSAKARAGTLESEEDIEMDAFERVGALLSTLKSKARQVLRRTRHGP